MQRNIAEVANETGAVVLFVFFWGGGGGATCERCNICTVTGEGTSFWNIVGHSFTINFVLTSWGFYKDLCCVKHNQLICNVRRQKNSHQWVWRNSGMLLVPSLFAYLKG